MHALIIEDETFVAMAIEDGLRDMGFMSFAFAVSPSEAIEAVAEQCPDLVTSDVKLNPRNGIDAVEEICGHSHIPVIFITGNPGDVHERLPQYHVLAKPVTVAALQTAVELVTSG